MLLNDQIFTVLLKTHENITIEIGKLGIFTLPVGVYIYTGSAKKNMFSRISRHLEKEKKLKWHIDFVLANEHVTVEIINVSNKAECELNQLTKGSMPIKKFGASDCKAGCGSHLKRLNI